MNFLKEKMTICPTKKFSQQKVKEMVTAPRVPQFQKLIDDTGDFLRFGHFSNNQSFGQSF